MAIQTFGDCARWHPHIHVLLADGLFRENGVFYLVRYYGWYSNRGRGERANRQTDAAAQSPPPAAVEVLDVSGYRPCKIPSPTWRECIKKVWEIDPLACPKCGGEMKIISFITDAAIIRRILEHLGLWRGKRAGRARAAGA